MAVGKGSMARAAKALEAKKDVNVSQTNATEKEIRQSVSVPSKQVMDMIVEKNRSKKEEKKDTSKGQCQIGHEMPVYYL